MGAESPAGTAVSPERKERRVAASRRPSFLKRQKEQKRLARSLEKREARQARRRARAEAQQDSEPTAVDGSTEPVDTEAPTPPEEPEV